MNHNKFQNARLHVVLWISTLAKIICTHKEKTIIMAFDRPIEADRIDDFNLFSAFVRAPLWILGGVLGGNRSMNEDDHGEIRRLDDFENENIPPDSTMNSPYGSRIVSDYDLASMDSCHVITKIGSCNELSSSDNITEHTLKRTKNLSWSDESGKSLVEYDDEVSYSYNRNGY